MQYVVDASVVAEFLMGGPYSANVVAFLGGAFSGDIFAVPDLCLNECTNVIWKAVRFRAMPIEQAEQALRDLKALPLKRTTTKSVLTPALSIGLRHELAIYDSIYIALAARSSSPLVSLDQKQIRTATAEDVIVKPITDFGS
jgi:predicted nucleic acid-binding protein